MVITGLFKSFADDQRIRMVSLLVPGSLCVCHLIQLLEIDPIKMSKQLAYLKQLEILEVKREKNWKIYSIREEYRAVIVGTIDVLMKEQKIDLPLEQDLSNREELLSRLSAEESCSIDALNAC